MYKTRERGGGAPGGGGRRRPGAGAATGGAQPTGDVIDAEVVEEEKK